MLRLAPIAALASLLALPSLAEDAPDDPAKVYGAAVKNMAASEGFHLETKIDVEMGDTSMPGGSVEGVIRNPDSGHFKLDIAGNALDLFKEGEHVALLNPQTGKWEGQANNQTLDFLIHIFNLGTLLAELRDGAQNVAFGDPEDVGKRECRTVMFEVPKATLAKLIKGNGKGSLGVSPENAKMRVKTWIDNKDSLPRKIQIVIDVELKGLPGADGDNQDEWEDWEEGKDGKKKDEKKEEPKADGGDKKAEGGDEGDEGDSEVPPMKITITVDASIKNYGKDLDVEMPAGARKVLDEQKKKKTTPTEPGEEKK